MRLFLCLVSASTMILGPSLPSYSVEVQGDVELLRLIATEYSDNVARIKTWTGTAEIQDSRTDTSDNTGYTRKSNADFCYSRDLDAFRWRWETSNLASIKEHAISEREPYLTTGMVFGQNYFTLQPLAPDDTKTIRRLVVKARPSDVSSIAIWNDEFNPMYPLQFVPDLPKMLDWYVSTAGKEGGIPAKVTRHGDLVELNVTGPAAINVYTFDLSKKGNLVKFYIKDASVEQLFTCDFEQAGLVWLPTKVTFKKSNLSNRDGRRGESSESKSVVFHHGLVNEPLPQGEFTLAKLLMRPGDSVSDSRLGLAYTYMEETEELLDSQLLKHATTLAIRVATTTADVTAGSSVAVAALPCSRDAGSGIWWAASIISIVVMAGIALIAIRRRRCNHV